MREEIVADDLSEKQIWHYPGPDECLVCHNANAGFVLGFNTRQMNRNVDSASGRDENQLLILGRQGLLAGAPSAGELASLARLAPLDDASADLEHRVRSYLDVNCAHCHQPHEARADFDARFEVPAHERAIINGAVVSTPSAGPMRIVAPGKIEHSLLVARMASLGDDRMPPMGGNLPDEQAIELISRWIRELPPERTSDEALVANAAVRPWYLRRRYLGAGVVLVLAAVCWSWARGRRRAAAQPVAALPRRRAA
jgi:mono/diheme cytochrome c family protein